jgi:hypothetical protein
MLRLTDPAERRMQDNDVTAPYATPRRTTASTGGFLHIPVDDFRIVRDNMTGRQRSTHDRLVPHCLFTDPPLAQVGLTEREAERQGTSGQIMSGVALIEEAKAGWPSAETADVTRPFTPADLSKAEIRERMSGNLCRCACYPNIVDAVSEVAGRG